MKKVYIFGIVVVAILIGLFAFTPVSINSITGHVAFIDGVKPHIAGRVTVDRVSGPAATWDESELATAVSDQMRLDRANAELLGKKFLGHGLSVKHYDDESIYDNCSVLISRTETDNFIRYDARTTCSELVTCYRCKGNSILSKRVNRGVQWSTWDRLIILTPEQACADTLHDDIEADCHTWSPVMPEECKPAEGEVLCYDCICRDGKSIADTKIFANSCQYGYHDTPSVCGTWWQNIWC